MNAAGFSLSRDKEINQDFEYKKKVYWYIYVDLKSMNPFPLRICQQKDCCIKHNLQIVLTPPPTHPLSPTMVRFHIYFYVKIL